MIISVGEVSLRLRRERLIFGLTTERWKFDKTEWLTKVTSINNEAFSLKRSCLKEGPLSGCSETAAFLRSFAGVASRRARKRHELAFPSIDRRDWFLRVTSLRRNSD